MNKDVYLFILHTYGRNIGQWIGLFAELFRVVVMRIYIAIAIAQITASVASGNFDLAKKHTLYFFIAYLTASLVGALGELLSTHIEDKQYTRLSLNFYQKLVGKDISFYRNNQTGYLASIFRQHLDAMMLLLRFFRGEALGAFISLVIPPIVLFFVSPKVSAVVAIIVLIQFIYVRWSSSQVHKYRDLAHEMYRKTTGEVSDVITNIIAFKSGGIEDRVRDNIIKMIQQESRSFELRRRTAVLLDLPRSILTACGITIATYLIISQSSGSNPQSLGLIVLTLTYMFQMIRSVDILPSLITCNTEMIMSP